MTETHNQNNQPKRSEPKKTIQVNKKKNEKSNIRKVWNVARWFLIPVLCIIALVVGLIIGYSYLGDEEAADVFQLETWKHLLDLIFAD